MSLWLDKLQRAVGIRRSRGTSPSYGNYIVWRSPLRGWCLAIIGRQFLLVVIVDCLLDVTCAAVAYFDCVAVEYFPEGVLVGKTLVYQGEEFLSDVCLHTFAKRWVVP